MKGDLAQRPGTEYLPAEDAVTLGDWYWLKTGDKEEFVCATHVGSNFVQLSPPFLVGQSSRSWTRVHFDKLAERVRKEPNPTRHIQEQASLYATEASTLLAELHRLTQSLGVAPVGSSITDGQESASRALSVLSGTTDIKAYEKALIEAQQHTIPDLVERIKSANLSYAIWMSAMAVSAEAKLSPMKGTIDTIKNRVFHISLYAGLTEELVLCRDGAPAPRDEKLRVMQRRLYMDEECLLNFDTGGMEFSDISEFDAWMSRPENFERILPFERTIVAMRVRRNIKDRDAQGDLLRAFINIQIEASDKFTFLYIRNGGQIWRLSTEIDFGEQIFPSEGAINLNEPHMFNLFGSRVDKIITRAKYDYMAGLSDEMEARRNEWLEANPGKDWMSIPYELKRDVYVDGIYFSNRQWHALDPSSVYYDDASKKLKESVDHFNRVALIIQGLFDRSECLTPHVPVNLARPEDFSRCIELIYDSNETLYHGERPDFEAYRTRCNKSIGEHSVLIGQHLFWLKAEAVKENARRDRDWRSNLSHRVKVFEPYGNDGPSDPAVPASWKPRSRQAIFRWERRSSDYSRFIPTSITVPATELFNVSAYKPGDYLQFFKDPRTREDYLRWAPLLLTAERYHAGIK